MQELLLAKHPVIYCGPCVMPWETVFRIWVKFDTGKEISHSEKSINQASSNMRMDITQLDALRG